jgi:hypothetical protein
VTHQSFELSSDDRKEPDPSLSVWASRLTSLREALAFFDRTETYTKYAEFSAAEIRRLRPNPDNPDIISLDVEWRTLPADVRYLNGSLRPGADGHCGIVGFKRSKSTVGIKPAMFSLRSQLADLANQRIREVEKV